VESGEAIMPVGETIADYLRGRRAEKRAAGNDAWTKLQGAVNTGVDIWKTVNEQNKYKPGSNYYEFQKKSLVDWPTDAARQKAEIELSQSKSFLDYQRANPMKPAEQLFQEWLLTPEGQKSLADQWKRDQERMGVEHKFRMEEIAASRNPKEGELQSRLTDAINEVTMLRPDWTTQDPNNPNNSILDLSKAADIKEAVLAYFSDPAERAWAEKMLDKTISTWKPNVTPPKTGVNQTPYPGSPKPVPSKRIDAQALTDLKNRIIEARNKLKGDPNATKELNYMYGELPTLGNPGGGKDFSKDQLGWYYGAIEALNKLLGYASPPGRTFQVNPGARR
jgi:hypothetical protein